MSMESKQSTNLEAWLTHPGADEYFGRRTAFKIAVLAHLLSGQGTLADVGRRFGAGRSAACHHATKARKLFGIA